MGSGLCPEAPGREPSVLALAEPAAASLPGPRPVSSGIPDSPRQPGLLPRYLPSPPVSRAPPDNANFAPRSPTDEHRDGRHTVVPTLPARSRRSALKPSPPSSAAPRWEGCCRGPRRLRRQRVSPLAGSPLSEAPRVPAGPAEGGQVSSPRRNAGCLGRCVRCLLLCRFALKGSRARHPKTRHCGSRPP